MVQDTLKRRSSNMGALTTSCVPEGGTVGLKHAQSSVGAGMDGGQFFSESSVEL